MKKLFLNLIAGSRIFANYNQKKYFEALENDSVLKLGSYKISALSKFLISRNNLVQISNLKKRNFNIFKEILGRKYSPHQNFDLKQNYSSYTPYLFPIEIKDRDELHRLIQKGFPIIRWPIFPKSQKDKSKNYNNLYFVLLNHTISTKYFKKLLVFVQIFKESNLEELIKLIIRP